MVIRPNKDGYELCNPFVSETEPNRPNSSSVTSTWRITEIQEAYIWLGKWTFVILCHNMPGTLRCLAQLTQAWFITPGRGLRHTLHVKSLTAAVNRQNSEAAANPSAWGIRMTWLHMLSPKQSCGTPQGINLPPKPPALRRGRIIGNTQMNYFAQEDRWRLLAPLPTLTSRHVRP